MNEEIRERNKEILDCLKNHTTMNVELPGRKNGYYKFKNSINMGKRMILAHERTGETQVVEASAFFSSLQFNQEEKELATIILKLNCQ